ncbi:hypothetical protein [Adhaeribacter pallidiroseus]|nr:hypothetical protein [Adhaeribacter pallidiroseus]
MLKRSFYSTLTIAQDYLPEINVSRTAEQSLTDKPAQAALNPS